MFYLFLYFFVYLRMLVCEDRDTHWLYLEVLSVRIGPLRI
nr:MAG TPA: hypothetical protein [Caudoviricetes sp.]